MNIAAAAPRNNPVPIAAPSSPKAIALTGIKPTGKPHLGNYFSAIKPAIDLTHHYNCYYFIANYHALNTVKDAQRLQEETFEIVATWLACGLDPNHVTFYLQSDIPELFEITTILMAYTSKGLMNRAHAYKAVRADNEKNGRDFDNGVNMGLFNYPIMMAADILAFKTHKVPIGKDQLQHLEMTQDIAAAFNREVKTPCLLPPTPLVKQDVATIIGIDGRKMSKSYHNVIPLFAEDNVIKKAVMKIVTTSQDVAAPKDPDTCHIFSIYKLLATQEETTALAEKYRAGGMSWGVAKNELYHLILTTFKEKRTQYNALRADKHQLKKILAAGKVKARAKAQATLAEMKACIGLAGF